MGNNKALKVGLMNEPSRDGGNAQPGRWLRRRIRRSQSRFGLFPQVQATEVAFVAYVKPSSGENRGGPAFVLRDLESSPFSISLGRGFRQRQAPMLRKHDEAAVGYQQRSFPKASL